MYYVTKYNNNNASYTTLFSWSSIWLLVLRLSLSSKISALVVLHRISMVCSWWIITSKVACGLNSTVYFQFLMMPWAKSLSKASGYLKLTHARSQCPALNAHCSWGTSFSPRLSPSQLLISCIQRMCKDKFQQKWTAHSHGNEVWQLVNINVSLHSVVSGASQ